MQRRSRRYALIVFGERPSAASLLPKASDAWDRLRFRSVTDPDVESGLLNSRSLPAAVFVIVLVSFLHAPAHGGSLGQRQFIDATGLFGPDKEHAQHALGLIHRGLGPFLSALQFQERIGFEEFPNVGNEDAGELSFSTEEGFDLFEILSIGVEGPLRLALGPQMFNVGLRGLMQCRFHHNSASFFVCDDLSKEFIDLAKQLFNMAKVANVTPMNGFPGMPSQLPLDADHQFCDLFLFFSICLLGVFIAGPAVHGLSPLLFVSFYNILIFNVIAHPHTGFVCEGSQGEFTGYLKNVQVFTVRGRHS
jgi:hypothetical protein